MNKKNLGVGTLEITPKAIKYVNEALKNERLSYGPFIKKFDVLHVHLFPALYWVAFAKLLSLSKKPLVYTEHNTFNKRRIPNKLK